MISISTLSGIIGLVESGTNGVKTIIDYCKDRKKRAEFRETVNDRVLDQMLEMIKEDGGRDLLLTIRDAARAHLPVNRNHLGLAASKDYAVARTLLREQTIIVQLIAIFKSNGQHDAIKHIMGKTLSLLGTFKKESRLDGRKTREPFTQLSKRGNNTKKNRSSKRV